MESLRAKGIPRRKTILFAEDEQSVRWATRLLLTIDGHKVTEAESGPKALDLFKEGTFDLVITDYHMPKMTGNELAAKIKDLAPTQPILLITAYGDQMQDADLPVNGTLAKPFTIEDLREAMRRVLGDNSDCGLA